MSVANLSDKPRPVQQASGSRRTSLEPLTDQQAWRRGPGLKCAANLHTIDFEVALSGEVMLELDDGVEKVLRPGDTVVQNGTRHRWGNRGNEPAVLALFVVGAHRASE
jgi:hypothetical protein